MIEDIVQDEKLEFLRVDTPGQFPEWASRKTVEDFLHHKMKPFEDTPEDIHEALEYCFSDEGGKGGFTMLTRVDGKLGGICVMLKTGMKGYVPEWILLMISVDPELRGRGIGQKLAKKCLDEVNAPVKLHVEYDNPAKRLYERIGFTSKYAEMRYNPGDK